MVFWLIVMVLVIRSRTALLLVGMGYDPLLFDKLVIGINRRIPVDFFICISGVLDLTRGETNALVGSWAFGVDRWNWLQSYEAPQT